MKLRLLLLTCLLITIAAAQAAPAAGVSGHYSHSRGPDNPGRPVEIYYHKPASFTPQSPVLVVLPGSGRNAWDYRDAWISASETHGVLIVSPSYSEEHYPMFWQYNIGGMIEQVRINEARTGFAHYRVVKDPRERIFRDFDAIFAEAAQRFGAQAERYDLFGHSAGGQIVHRLALIRPQNRARHLIAANAGWYTVPRFDTPFPYGLQDSGVTRAQLRQAFGAHLVLLLGERDDETETRGHLARNPTLDRQGTHRLARGRYFFDQAQAKARQIGATFRWEKRIVPDVGHNYRKMSQAAARALYGEDLLALDRDR